MSGSISAALGSGLQSETLAGKLACLSGYPEYLPAIHLNSWLQRTTGTGSVLPAKIQHTVKPYYRPPSE